MSTEVLARELPASAPMERREAVSRENIGREPMKVELGPDPDEMSETLPQTMRLLEIPAGVVSAWGHFQGLLMAYLDADEHVDEWLFVDQSGRHAFFRNEDDAEQAGLDQGLGFDEFVVGQVSALSLD
jgi:hypothetical protein